jgi:hypothetical protein
MLELRRRRSGEPLLATATGAESALRCAPHHCAPALMRIEPDEPVRLLRTWWDPDGRRWLQVQSMGVGSSPRRGWLAG